VGQVSDGLLRVGKVAKVFIAKQGVIATFKASDAECADTGSEYPHFPILLSV
jgi:hypothetical protein